MSEECNRVFCRFLPEGFAVVAFLIFAVTFGCGLVISWYYDFLSLHPDKRDKQKKDGQKDGGEL